MTLLCLVMWTAKAQEKKMTISAREQVTKVTGYLPYLKGKTETVSLQVWNENDIVEPSRTLTMEVTDGHFAFDMMMSDFGQFTLTIGENSVPGNDSVGVTGHMIFISPGDSLHIVMPGEKSQFSKDILVTGRGAEKYELMKAMNSALAKKLVSIKGRSVAESLKRTMVQAMEENASVKDVINDAMDKNKGMVDPRDYNRMRAKVNGINCYSLVLIAENMDFSKAEDREAYLRLSPGYKLSDLVVKDKGKVSVSSPNFLIQKLLADDAVAKQGADKIARRDYSRVYAVIRERLADKAVRSPIVASYIISQVKHKGWLPALDSITRHYLAETPKSDHYRRQVEQFATKMRTNLKEDAVAYNFSLKDSTGKVHRQKDFLGKVVLLDFMFYGCGGCKAITPWMDSLELRFHGKDVQFISISIDPTMAKFKQSIGKYSSGAALALYTNGDSNNNPVIGHYGVNAFPTVVLIGKDGKVILSRAPAPYSQEGLDKLAKIIDDVLQRY